MKSRSNVPTRVIGMHNTPNSTSDMAKLSRKTLVMVRIRRFWINVKMTSVLPTMANNKIVAYKIICMRSIDSHDDVDDVDATIDVANMDGALAAVLVALVMTAAAAAATGVGIVDVFVVVLIDMLLLKLDILVTIDPFDANQLSIT